jgi:hypothetical protein
LLPSGGRAGFTVGESGRGRCWEVRSRAGWKLLIVGLVWASRGEGRSGRFVASLGRCLVGVADLRKCLIAVCGRSITDTSGRVCTLKPLI